MIERICLKFGAGPGIKPDVIENARVTLFVGPNNSGKSKVLREIEERDYAFAKPTLK